MKSAYGMIALVALAMPSLASAQAENPALSTSDVRRLTPEQIEAVLAEAAAKRASEAKRVPADAQPVSNQDSDDKPAPQVHGEVGFGVGTGGYRETFGTAIYPIGEDGVAAISLDFVDLGHRRFPR